MVGDGLMAIFGAPLPLNDPCGAAARAALDMIEMIELFNREPDRAGKPVIAIGIGIASGDVIAGYTGTQNRATYTCVGDAVNLAARLEAHSRRPVFPILIDEATRLALGDAARYRASVLWRSGAGQQRLTCSHCTPGRRFATRPRDPFAMRPFWLRNRCPAPEGNNVDTHLASAPHRFSRDTRTAEQRNRCTV